MGFLALSWGAFLKIKIKVHFFIKVGLFYQDFSLTLFFNFYPRGPFHVKGYFQDQTLNFFALALLKIRATLFGDQTPTFTDQDFARPFLLNQGDFFSIFSCFLESNPYFLLRSGTLSKKSSRSKNLTKRSNHFLIKDKEKSSNIYIYTLP